MEIFDKISDLKHEIKDLKRYKENVERLKKNCERTSEIIIRIYPTHAHSYTLKFFPKEEILELLESHLLFIQKQIQSKTEELDKLKKEYALEILQGEK